MLVEQLSIAYRFHSCIGNSIDLKEMIHEVLRTFISESYAVYGEFCIFTKDGEYEKIDSFGKYANFDSSKYLQYDKKIEIIMDDNVKILKMNLDKGSIFLITTDLESDCSFFYSLFESLIPKLNINVNACLNYQELEKSYELLTKQKKDLIKANKTKDDFLANMSHELKTPLNSIIVISTLMAKNKSSQLDERHLKNIKIIKKCADDLLELISDILDISKIEAGELSIHKEKMNLLETIDEIVDAFFHTAIEKGISLKKVFNGENFFITSDERRIKQILKNLLSNAIKFTNIGSVTIKLEEDIDYLNVEVIDTGIGIEEEHLEHIFDRFKQVDNSRTRKYGGTGLGLAISNELAFILNSTLSVKSQINIGSSFILKIPKDSCTLKNIKKHQKNYNENIVEDSSLILEEKTKIFIKHFDDIKQFKLAIGLKKEGYKVFPIVDLKKLELELSSSNKKKIFVLLDKNIYEFESIIDILNKYNEKIYLISNIDEEFDFTLENIIEQIKLRNN